MLCTALLAQLQRKIKYFRDFIWYDSDQKRDQK